MICRRFSEVKHGRLCPKDIGRLFSLGKVKRAKKYDELIPNEKDELRLENDYDAKYYYKIEDFTKEMLYMQIQLYHFGLRTVDYLK